MATGTTNIGDSIPAAAAIEATSSGSSSKNDLGLLSSRTGQEFLQTFVDLLQDVVQVDFVAISELRVTDREIIQVKAGWMDGDSLQNFEYDACFTPCLEAIKSAEVVLVYEGVQNSFPNDELLQLKGLESFLGYPVVNAYNEVIGLIQLAWRRQTSEEECHQILDTIKDFSDRIATELENLRSLRVLQSLARGPDPTTSETVFHLITRQIQSLLGARAVFVAECSPTDKKSFDILAYCIGGTCDQDMDGRSLTYEGRPCKKLETMEEFRIDSGLAEAYADQTVYRTEGYDSYLGIRADDSEGNALGHMVVFHDEPITTYKLETELLTVFRDRLGFEILRKRSQVH
jgi:hypothetical protein